MVSYYNYVNIVKELLKRFDIDINLRNKKDKTAMDYNNKEIKKLLTNYKILIDIMKEMELERISFLNKKKLIKFYL